MKTREKIVPRVCWFLIKVSLAKETKTLHHLKTKMPGRGYYYLQGLTTSTQKGELTLSLHFNQDSYI